MRGLLLDDPRLSAAAREALARRVLSPTAKEVSFQDAEFDSIVTTAQRMFRAPHLRITDNARHLAQWQSGAFPRGGEAWLLGEALDCLARTGEAPHDPGAASAAGCSPAMRGCWAGSGPSTLGNGCF
ncbi:hypothetical protein QQY66_00420 [Streptomyces sp. DG2A-72]|uniref:hypothetical protein n=1 Tax=Streptomyces sp. DG2A-72 TaxID=3051386 RepID=UPI00265BB1E7|nr:hypothetical protein [Streptomyces sp. DG2A-72]MDO0930253.1 hypothetical protein [Streptomyces sp. DG2A-72]